MFDVKYDNIIKYEFVISKKIFSKLYIKKLKNTKKLKKICLYFFLLLNKLHLNVTKMLFNFRVFFVIDIIVIVIMILSSFL